MLRADLVELGFDVEASKRAKDKIKRPVFFGENAQPDLQYEVDAWHPKWRAGLEVEAGRAWMGNAIYRDLIQALVMVDMDHLFLAVPKAYLCLLFIHPRAPNFISLRSAGTMPA